MTAAAAPVDDLPEQLRAARARLFGEEDLYFVPVRHHSPACALALQHLLRELRPAAVLIEGPDDLDPLLPLLQDAQTRAPVAFLCQAQREAPPGEAEEGDEEAAAKPVLQTRSSFYPFCEHSPEWIAVREGAALGAQVAWIDLPWRDKAWREESPEDDGARSQMAERHFAHSRYLAAMARRAGCVDHHELWDRLFELRPAQAHADWRAFFGDVFTWCAMARRDYEPEVLEAELSLPRERHMASHIRRWRGAVTGPIVVVSGGFHTPELLDGWRGAAPLPRAAKVAAAAVPAAPSAWLIRYSFERLDALNGYASGMPSPGYHQQVWERWMAGEGSGAFQAVALECLTRFARQTRAQDQLDAVSTAGVQAAAAQAMRLAALRGNVGPGRQDLIDAIRSCFVKGAIDDGQQGFTADLQAFLGGTRIGDVPPSAGSPPLIEDARRLARAAGVRLDDSTARVARLDLYRKPSHRERSRFFHAMAYLDAGVGTWLAGPDFLGNSRLNLLFEEWRVAWSPLVEARLIELAGEGASVEAACMARLRREEQALAEEGRGRSASAAVVLLLRACLVGLHSRLPQLLAMLSAHLDEDANLGSVVACGHRLVTLWRAREPLGVQRDPQLGHLLARVWPAALFLLPNLAVGDEAAEAAAVGQLVSLRELGRLLAGLDAERGSTPVDLALLHAHLERFAVDGSVPPGVCGAAAALLYLDGAWDDHALAALVARRFGPGAHAREAVRFLKGMMAAGPELLTRLPVLLEGLDALVRRWDAEAFIAHLPDLRQAFTGLKPQETDLLAQRVAGLHGADEAVAQALAQVHHDTTEQDLMAGAQLELALAACLRRDGLADWVGPP